MKPPLNIDEYRQRVKQVREKLRDEAEEAFESLYTAYCLCHRYCEARSVAWVPKLQIRRARLDAILRSDDADRDFLNSFAESDA